MNNNLLKDGGGQELRRNNDRGRFGRGLEVQGRSSMAGDKGNRTGDGSRKKRISARKGLSTQSLLRKTLGDGGGNKSRKIRRGQKRGVLKSSG